MAEAYRWRCFACESVNEPSSVTCSNCGFPARASGRRIAEVQASKLGAQTRSDLSNSGGAFEKFDEYLRPLSPWRRAVAIFGFAVASGGMIWLKVTFSWLQMGIAMLTFFTGAALMGAASIGAKHHA